MLCQQVIFWDTTGGNSFGGILVDNEYIICGCCGSVFDLTEDNTLQYTISGTWTDFSDSIKRGE